MRAVPFALVAVFGTLTSATRLSAIPPAFDDAPLRSVRFVDANEGWAAGDDGLVLHTTDGGKTWDRQKTGTRASLRDLQFLTPYTGWAAGRLDRPTGSVGVLLHTTDGGLSWTEVGAGLLPGLNGVQFFDDRTGIVAGDGSDAFACGMFMTKDGGGSWAPVTGPACPTWLAADFADRSAGLVGGGWGGFAQWKDGKLSAAPAETPGARAVQAVRIAGHRGVMVGDGGMVSIATDGAWSPAELPVPPAVRAVCDFRCVAVHGENIWIAGRPGSVVLFSPDFGKTWQARKTGVTVPLHGLCMISEAVGWAVGDFGTILGTSDGGTTWALLRSGGQRAAVMLASGSSGGVPVAALPSLGTADGYLTTVLTLTSADAATANPDRAADSFRLAAAVRSAGGAAADALWGFPLPAHCEGLTPEQLLAFWDTHQGGKSREHLLRQFVLAVRMWRPDVIVADAIDPAAPAADRVMLFATQEAFKLAADPTAFPEQIEHLGLAPHAAKKLYARTPELAGAPVKLDAAAFRPDLADSPAVAAEPAAKLLAQSVTSAGLGFRLVSHRLDGSERHTALTDGCDLARGGTARRRIEPPRYSPQYLAQREGVIRSRKQLADLLASPSFEGAGEAGFTQVTEILKSVPDDAAAAALVSAAGGCVRDGRWTLARELYVLAANRYPTQPAAAAAYRWLVRYHASGEAQRRIELAQQPTFRATSFVALPPKATDRIVPASFTEPAGNRVQFRSAEAERDWVGTGVGLEPRLFVVEPAALRSPAAQLSFNAGRRRLGLTADAERNLRAYCRGMSAEGNPWFEAVASELWLANRGTAAAPPKPLAACRSSEKKPHLDGKLDDDCWKAASPLTVTAGPGELAKAHSTEARFTFDDEFLYVAVSCTHPEAQPPAKATKRRRDEDLRSHDRVELLLDIDRDFQTYYRLMIDERGCVAEDCCGDRRWDPRWFVAAEPTATGWTAEAAIPLAELTGSRPRHTHVWAVNVVRVLPGRGVLSWSGPADAIPRPEGMGLVEFQTR